MKFIDFYKSSKRDENGYPSLTLDDVKKAIALLPHKKILEKIIICKKQWKELEKQTEYKSNANPLWGSLSGIQVIIKPYLKKVRLFYEYT